jgi:hypothetical protein
VDARIDYGTVVFPYCIKLGRVFTRLQCSKLLNNISNCLVYYIY